MRRCTVGIPCRLPFYGQKATRLQASSRPVLPSVSFSSATSRSSLRRLLPLSPAASPCLSSSTASRWHRLIAGRRVYTNDAAATDASPTEVGRLTPAAAAELRHQLEARAEAGDAEAQFRLGVLHCFGTGGGGGCSNHKQALSEEDSPVIDKDSLNFLIGPGTVLSCLEDDAYCSHARRHHTIGYVVPKTDGENTRITNWKQWLKVSVSQHRSFVTRALIHKSLHAGRATEAEGITGHQRQNRTTRNGRHRTQLCPGGQMVPHSCLNDLQLAYAYVRSIQVPPKVGLLHSVAASHHRFTSCSHFYHGSARQGHPLAQHFVRLLRPKWSCSC